jgi:hypothetical protein
MAGAVSTIWTSIATRLRAVLSTVSLMFLGAALKFFPASADQ